MTGPFSVLQVCMGNICRSPMAERLMVAAARLVAGDRVGELLHVHGAGTGGWHAGDPMDRQAANQVIARGGDVGDFRARKLLAEHIDASDLVLTATAEQVDFVLELRPDAADRTFVIGEFGRLLPDVDLSELPRVGAEPGADDVYERGVALVAAVAELRGGKPPLPGDELDDPWGRADSYFSRVADEVDATVRPLVTALLGR